MGVGETASPGPVVSYEREGAVAVVTLDRPERLNAVNMALIEGLCAGLERARSEGAGAVVLTGAGRAFCAGHDFTQATEPDLEQARANLQRLQDVTRAIRSLSGPVIAAVHGYALGAGCEFALTSDLVVAARDAVFGFPEVEVGLAATGGITFLLPLIVGPSRAKELLFSGRRLGAEEAYALGLVTLLADDARRTALDLARDLAAKPAAALGWAKHCLDLGPEGDIEAAYAREVEASLALRDSADAREAAARFLAREAKRPRS